MLADRQDCLALLAAWALLIPSGATPAGELLQKASEVQALTLEEADERREVRLRGVVTFTWQTGTSELTLQDETGAVLLPPVPLPPGCRVGALVEIEGRTGAGGFGPIVQPEVARVLGESSLPPPVAATFEDLLAPRLHGRRVEIGGIVRGQRVNPELGLNWLALELATGGGRLTVNITHEIAGQPRLIDARVKVRGVNLHASDPHHQAFFPMLCAHTLADVEVLDPAPALPFEQEVVPLNSLLRSSGTARTGHRIHVRGVVTLANLKEGSFFLQDQTRGIQVFLREPPLARPAETVDVIGFAEPGAFSPVLRDADWRPADGDGARREPLPVTVEEAARHDGRLVCLQAKLSESVPAPGQTTLLLESGGSRFSAALPGGAGSPLLASLAPGGILRLTGVCQVLVGDWESLVTRRKPEGFLLLLRGPEDVILVQAASYWTPERLARFALAGAAMLAASLVLVWVRARRRLREAGEAREAARIEFAAILNERGRLAREIHDTLAQGFAGISAQLEALAGQLPPVPDPARRCLDAARDLVRESLAEARRSVWNLRAQTLEDHGLPHSIEQLGKKLTTGRGIEFRFALEGDPRALPADLENNLLRAGQEALTNAVRHAGARRISTRMRFEKESVFLEIADDGRGFHPSEGYTASQNGRFGLAGMQERAEAMHGKMEIRSHPETGTRVQFVVPAG